MTFNAILLLAGILLVVSGVLGAIINRAGQVTTLIPDVRARATLVILGLCLLVSGIWLEIRQQHNQLGDVRASLREKASPELASYLASCALDIARFSADYPIIPYKSSGFQNVFLSESSAKGRQLDELLREVIETSSSPAALAPAEASVDTVASGPGTGKSIVIKVIRKDFCSDALSGHLSTLLVARDGRRDLATPQGRNELRYLLKQLPTTLDGKAIRRVLLIDSLDELYFDSPQEATVLAMWAQDLASGPSPIAVYLFSRPFAVEAVSDSLQANGRKRLVAILGNLVPSADYFEKTVRAIIYHGPMADKSLGAPAMGREQLEAIVAKTERNLRSFLGEDWIARAKERNLVFRDLEAIIHVIHGGYDGAQLGDAYYLYALERLRRDLGVQFQVSGDLDVILQCLGEQALEGRLKIDPPAPPGVLPNSFCRKTIHYIGTERVEESSAISLLKFRHMELDSISGYVQDVAAAVGICRVPEEALEANLAEVARGRGQGPAIALSARRSLPSCPARLHRDAMLRLVDTADKRRYAL